MSNKVLPGSTLGMLGGGQLGRMFTMAARTMGYEVIVLDPDKESPAGKLATDHPHQTCSTRERRTRMVLPHRTRMMLPNRTRMSPLRRARMVLPRRMINFIARGNVERE